MEENIYKPEFIPYYISVAEEYKLTPLQTLVYWFIRFYTNKNKFYFQDEQIAEILWSTKGSISNTMTELEKKGIIIRNTKIISSNGSIRNIQLHFSMNPEFTFEWNLASLENEVKKNNKNNNKYNICAEEIFSLYKKGVDIENKYLYPSATKLYIEQLLKEYDKEQLILSIQNYFAVTEKKWRKSPKYFFSNSKRSDNYRMFEGFLNKEEKKQEIKRISVDDFIP